MIKKALYWTLFWFAMLVPLAAVALPTYSGFTTRATGYVVQASDWNNEFGNLIAYVNTNLTATFNQILNKGYLLVGNGTSPVALTNAGAADDGKLLQLDSSQGVGMKWVGAVGGVTQLTTKGDILGYGFNLARIPVGIDGQSLVADSTNVNGVSYQNVLPSGSIILWSGSVGTIPTGFALCDGVVNAPGPNLQGLFVVGAGNTNGAASGGMGLLPPGGPRGDISAGIALGPSHSHTLAHSTVAAGSVNNATGFGSSPNYITNTVPVTPRYYALAYIQKL